MVTAVLLIRIQKCGSRYDENSFKKIRSHPPPPPQGLSSTLYEIWIRILRDPANLMNPGAERRWRRIRNIALVFLDKLWLQLILTIMVKLTHSSKLFDP